jgi:hypothetical protein
MTHKNQQAVQKSKRDTTALALLGAMLVVLAIVCGTSLSAAGAGAFQHVMNTFGFGRTADIEAEQQRQAATLAALEPVIQTMAADLGTLNRRVKTTDANPTINERFAAMDADIAGLVAEIKAMRTSQTSSQSWVDPVGRLDTAVSSTQSDVLALRSSFDEQSHAFRKDIGAINKDIGGINRRLDRLEQTLSHDLTSAIHVPVRKRFVRRKPRPHVVANRETSWWTGTLPPQTMAPQ